MDKKIAIIISPNWKNYAKKYLVDCIASLRCQQFDYQSKIFMIDNQTSQESYSYLQSIVPEAEIIRNQHNDGFAKGNNDALKLAMEQGYDYLILVNLDTVMEAGCLAELIKQAEINEMAGAVQARLMLWPDKSKINSLGNMTHFLGFGYSKGYKDEYQVMGVKEICYFSGAGVLLKSEILKKVGLFDEEFWMYNEDQDLGWRLWLAGYKCLLAPEAVIYHKYSFAKSIKKYYWLDRNRLIVIFKNYHIATLILILPALFIMEIGLFFFAIAGGWFKEKLRVYRYFLKSSTWQYLKKARKEVQVLRQVSDKEIIKMFSGKILYQEINSIFLRIANFFFNLYWQLAKLIIIW